MKNLKLMALILAAGLAVSIGTKASAEVGYLNYQKVLDNYPAAQQAVKEIDAKSLELQQYMVDKEKQYKALDTPLKKQNFETQTATELRTKENNMWDKLFEGQTQSLTQKFLKELNERNIAKN